MLQLEAAVVWAAEAFGSRFVIFEFALPPGELDDFSARAAPERALPRASFFQQQQAADRKARSCTPGNMLNLCEDEVHVLTPRQKKPPPQQLALKQEAEPSTPKAQPAPKPRQPGSSASCSPADLLSICHDEVSVPMENQPQKSAMKQS